MKFFASIFKKNKNYYKISQEFEQSLVYMLTPKKRVKLNSKIVVPNSFCVVLLSKEKLLDVIPSGEHELNGFTISKACKINKLDKPSKKGYKKDLKLDFYFVNLNICKITNQIFVKKRKLNLNFALEFKINDSKKFLKFLTSERIVFDHKFASYFLTFSLSRVLYYYVLDNKNLNKENLITYATKKLNNIGVEVLNFNVVLEWLNKESRKEENTIKNNSVLQNNTNYAENLQENPYKTQILDENLQENAKILNNQQSFYNKNNEYNFNNQTIKENENNFENNLNTSSNIENRNNLHGNLQNENYFNSNLKNEYDLNYNLENTSNSNYNLENENNLTSQKLEPVFLSKISHTSLVDLTNIKGESVTYFVCDACGAKLPASSKVCYNCKKSFVEKNCCENCGKEIPKNLYVCPYCNAVLFNN